MLKMKDIPRSRLNEICERKIVNNFLSMDQF